MQSCKCLGRHTPNHACNKFGGIPHLRGSYASVKDVRTNSFVPLSLHQPLNFSTHSYIAIFIGYVVARTGLFPPAASRSSSQLTMNVALPCLIFSNIVPAFTPSNISAIGPLMLLAVIYIFVGFASGLIIREICFVPRNFWQGIIIAAGMSNWGNLRE